MIGKLRDFFIGCPFLEPSNQHGFVVVGVDYLQAETAAYSIESMGGAVWHQEFYNKGHGIKRLDFAFSSIQPFSPEEATTIGNVQFFEKLDEWTQSQRFPHPFIEIEFTRPQIDYIDEGEKKAQYKIIGVLKYSV